MGSKELKILLEDNESLQDRISVLPDSLIHHILSFLPSTKHAIRTSVLSKQWQKQWTHVPLLVFDFLKSNATMSQMSSLIDNTLILYNCSKIKKFHLRLLCWYDDHVGPDTDEDDDIVIPDPDDVDSMFADLDSICDEKLRFAITKEVEEIILNFRCMEMFRLPDFVFNSASLVKLHVNGCVFNPVGRVYWPNLKHLYVDSGWFRNQSIETVVSGSLLLESLELNRCDGLELVVIASKSLKRLVLRNLGGLDCVLTISCPNLVEFCATNFGLSGSISTDRSSRPLNQQVYKQLDINSNSLKKLVLAGIQTDQISVTCPNLEEFNLYSLDLKSKIIKLICLPSSSLYVDFNFSENPGSMIVRQLESVKELKIGPRFIKILSAMEIAGASACQSLNKKCLTFDCGPNFAEYVPGIAYALRSSSELEKLVITLQLPEYPTLQDRPDLYRNPNGAVFDCLVSHLKIVKVTGLSEKDDNLSFVLNFVKFLLKNGRVLEKMVIVLQDCSTNFVLEVSQKLLAFPRYSQHVMVEII